MLSSRLNSFVVANPKRCIGCKACEVACAVTHCDRQALTVGAMDIPVIPRLYLVKTAEVTMPVQCHHCEDAPCANVCPIGAITQTNNSITINEEICVGCKTCSLACPFGAIDLVPQYKQGQEVIQNALKIKTDEGLVDKAHLIASKCDLCSTSEQGPACVEACPQQALEVFSPIKEKKSRNEEAALMLLDSVKKFLG
ncbi:4Fe-4S dicluster domain-containing protein [Sporomusa sphaeroides DSM 2875]|uniref:4Fe-4S dicluster domain-containing protein n=1 Tax=Sporomusa sphaeroides TaxID=47679 RepID=UPI00202E8D5B|nr:4Fe-4S dicluster domain-containing protein [Sporomusa sphaeroides]MCM0761511.1 4Fe-4S dicluster domain-containing protein [Sporomusa sphaeroides DSM 2875]